MELPVRRAEKDQGYIIFQGEARFLKIESNWSDG